MKSEVLLKQMDLLDIVVIVAALINPQGPIVPLQSGKFTEDFFVCLNHINIHVQHMQAIQGQTEACSWDMMPYFYNRQLGLFYIHYHIDMITVAWSLMNQSAVFAKEVVICRLYTPLHKSVSVTFGFMITVALNCRFRNPTIFSTGWKSLQTPHQTVKFNFWGAKLLVSTSLTLACIDYMESSF